MNTYLRIRDDFVRKIKNLSKKLMIRLTYATISISANKLEFCITIGTEPARQQHCVLWTDRQTDELYPLDWLPPRTMKPIALERGYNIVVYRHE